MKNWKRRLAAWLLILTLCAAASTGRAVLSDVYLTAVNDSMMDLNDETMPFWSGGVLYVSSRIFDGTDLGVYFVRNQGLVMLYNARLDLRFDLDNQLTYDKQGTEYDGHAVERNGIVFFPLDMVCSYFGLNWSSSRTETVPLIRITSSSAILSTNAFLDAAAWKMNSLYADYEKAVTATPPPTSDGDAVQPNRPGTTVTPTPEDPPPVHAAEGQKIFLLIESGSAKDTKAAMEILGSVQATFLLRAEQMEDGDLLRGLLANGHGAALLAEGETEEAVAGELSRARELLWKAACGWLELVWYEGGAEIGPLLEAEGCVRISAGLDRWSQGLRSTAAADVLLQSIGRYQKDLGVHLGQDSGCLGGLRSLLAGLEAGSYRLCAWRLA